MRAVLTRLIFSALALLLAAELALLLIAGIAFAQQPATPLEQALSFKLSREMSDGIQCSAGAVTLQQELAKAQARIKELEAKAAKPDGEK